MEEILSELATINKKLNKFDERLISFDSRFLEFNKTLDENFASFDDRISALETKIPQIEQCESLLSKSRQDILHHDQKFELIDRRVNDVERQLRDVGYANTSFEGESEQCAPEVGNAPPANVEGSETIALNILNTTEASSTSMF